MNGQAIAQRYITCIFLEFLAPIAPVNAQGWVWLICGMSREAGDQSIDYFLWFKLNNLYIYIRRNRYLYIYKEVWKQMQTWIKNISRESQKKTLLSTRRVRKRQLSQYFLFVLRPIKQNKKQPKMFITGIFILLIISPWNEREKCFEQNINMQNTRYRQISWRSSRLKRLHGHDD